MVIPSHADDEIVLDLLLKVVRGETLQLLRGEDAIIATGDIEGDAIRSAALSLTLLVRRWREQYRKPHGGRNA